MAQYSSTRAEIYLLLMFCFSTSMHPIQVRPQKFMQMRVAEGEGDPRGTLGGLRVRWGLRWQDSNLQDGQQQDTAFYAVCIITLINSILVELHRKEYNWPFSEATNSVRVLIGWFIISEAKFVLLPISNSPMISSFPVINAATSAVWPRHCLRTSTLFMSRHLITSMLPMAAAIANGPYYICCTENKRNGYVFAGVSQYFYF